MKLSPPITVTTPARATLYDRFYVLGPHIAKLILGAITGILSRPFSTGKRPPTFYRDVFYSIVRANINSLNNRQEQWIIPGTEASYLNLAKKEGFQPDTDVLKGSGGKLHWIGNKSAEKVLLYYHGGGFSLPCSDAHFLWAREIQKELSKGSDGGFSIAMLEYTLSPEGQYPKQLQQAAEALEYLLEKGGRKPENIFIGGDSAGGNITMMVLGHLLHPHPQVPYLKKPLASPLAGVLFISPWTKFGTDDDSGVRNRYSDYVTTSVASRWSSAFLGSQSGDNYSEAGLADQEWFSGLDKLTSAIFLWGGGGELLIDSIDTFYTKVKNAHPNVEYVVQPDAAHEQLIMDKAIGIMDKNEGTKQVENWFRARL